MSLSNKRSEVTHTILNITVIVAALGYFVDIYDLILFGVVRDASLISIGVPKDQTVDVGVYLFNFQMVGMLLGGIVWGILGDKRGRMTALFLTILIYSLANIANGFVQNIEQYSWLRFIAGFGLAGELGLGITLVSEVMSKEKRGWGSSIVSGAGLIGAAVAYLVAQWGWREAYFFGGGLGLLLLFMRIYLHESGMFEGVKEQNVKRGDFFSLFTNKKRFFKYLFCIAVGLPVWFVIGILVFFSNKFGSEMGVQGDIIPGKSIMIHYIGASMGSFLIGYISQLFGSRKKALNIALVALFIFCIAYFCSFNFSTTMFYFIIFILGIAQGYWAVFITVASEQFGTNIRSTITTTVPNFVRGATVLMSLWWKWMAVSMGYWQSAIIVGAVVMTLAFISTYLMEETFGKDLDYVE